jgi:hypothetical protein
MAETCTEANIRIVEGGTNLSLDVRRLKVSGQDVGPEILNLACDRLRKNKNLISVPTDVNDEPAILVASTVSIQKFTTQGDDWYLEAVDDGSRTLRFGNLSEAFLMARLFENGMMSRIAWITKRWVINRFPRTFYDLGSFRDDGDISAYRSYEVSCFPIEGVGVGISMEVNTAFFSLPTVADYFRGDLSPSRRDELQKRFFRLVGRQKGKKGLLLYNNGRTNTTCYFDSFQPDMTCGSTGKFRINNQTHESLTAYPIERGPFRKTGPL